MKKLSLVVLGIMFVTIIYSQEERKNKFDVNFETKIEQSAHYPEGNDAFFQYVLKNINFSNEALELGINKSIMLNFNVNTDSTITSIVIFGSVGYGVDEEVKRILSETKFAPAIINGIKTRQNVMMSIPVKTPSKGVRTN